MSTFSPDKMLYVVEHGQSNHFSNLFEIVSLLTSNNENQCTLQHVKFGRIQGMSTRKGTIVFLSDILEEAKDRMLEKMKSTETTKVYEENEVQSVAGILGISGIYWVYA